MKRKLICIPIIAAAALIVCVTGCTIKSLPGPLYVPESTAVTPPEPRIPNEFVGCWKGTLDKFDSVTPLSPSVSVGDIKTISTSYTMCFEKRPDGTGAAKLADIQIAGREATVTHFDNRFTSLGPGIYHATMRTHVTFESIMYVLLIIPVHVVQDVYADEEIQMITPTQVLVTGKELVVIGGNMVASMTFHTNFYKVAPSGDLASQSH